jgi:ABC-type transporter Mla subunit MlaD
VADSVGTVKTFVQDNRKALVTDVEKLTRLMKTINSERDSIDTALAVAPVAINNLTLAYNAESGTIGSRIGIQGQLWDADGFLCAIVQQSQMPKVSKDLACTIFKQLLEPVESNVPAIPGSGKQTSASAPPEPAARTQARYSSDDTPTLTGLLGGGS